jgi:hypothetical protein
MSVQDALDQYKVFGCQVFGKPRTVWVKSALWFPRPKYSASQKRKAILHIIKAGLKDPSTSNVTVEKVVFAMQHQMSEYCQR